ncbi:hypothetical protein P353_16770 [Comamonas testosteroni]|uniref:Uncharacterized protein n=1 Tax=Comamonas testosteroni TaxID=285 RepID=A0A096FD87_COMTE|nr:hypothetical protein P353_16770 [Comamonas testosteroni]
MQRSSISKKLTGCRQAELDTAVAAIGQLARLDGLYANVSGGTLLPLGSITQAHCDETLDRNVWGVVFTVQKALRLLDKTTVGASVILAGSTTSVLGTVNFSIYSATKAAVRKLTRSWVLGLKGRAIRVKTLSPGAMHTWAWWNWLLRMSRSSRACSITSPPRCRRATWASRKTCQGRCLLRHRRLGLR